ncbi:flagellar hook-associated family protein [Microvirga sp. BT689]|uniref:flagellar hook-associated family protein n=1 Tax=Microvirga arvi TaxID=2778731 RepID=UPI0019513F16|nr:flagellar hook-associated family protein [Microvirga arvi]MBM6580009.1 flagellar hook-associated family protein [Microvirga arvi]
MRTTFVSTVSLWNSSKSTLDKLQANLVKANKELTTGRDADVGLKLGYKTGTTLSLRQDRAELDVLTDSNASTTLRLKSMTKVLDQFRSNADKLMDALISTPLTSATMGVLKYQAQAGLSSLTTALNSDVNGQFVFGGVNSQEKPFNDYLGGAAPSAAKAALDAAFAAAPPAGFGFPQSAAGVSTITPADMDTFLNGSFANLFTGANWQNWSNASSENIQSRISPLERVEVTANANDEAIQKLTMAYTMVFDLGIDRLSEETREVLVNKVIGTLSKAVSGMTEISARLGTVQEKLEQANERMSLQKIIFEEKIAHLEAVDPAEAKIRVDQIMTQIQTSYSLTAQLKGLSLINYL